MARKPASRTEYVTFDVFYEDGSQRSNRKVPSSVLGGGDAAVPDSIGIHNHRGPMFALIETA